jgi:sodium/bile acid cotransporter 7
MRGGERRFRALIAALAAAGVLLGAAPGPAADAGAGAAADSDSDIDARNLARVESMYAGYRKDFAEVGDIGVGEAMRLAAEGRAVFVDVREEKEQRVSMLPGAVTEAEFLKHPEAFAGRTPIGYCTISYRSGKLAQKLKAKGITMLNLRGGLLAWVHAGGKVYDARGETRRIHVYGKKWNLGPKSYSAVW